MRLIDADALHDDIVDSYMMLHKLYEAAQDEQAIKNMTAQLVAFAEFAMRVEDAPTIDAEPVRHDDYMAHIQQLEASNTELLTKVEQLESKCRQLERERDCGAGWNDAVDAMPRWIRVEERLPDDQRDVLTVNGHGYIRKMGLFRKRGEQWTWLHEGRFKHYNDITHWMPLPEPPKEE